MPPKKFKKNLWYWLDVLGSRSDRSDRSCNYSYIPSLLPRLPVLHNKPFTAIRTPSFGESQLKVTHVGHFLDLASRGVHQNRLEIHCIVDIEYFAYFINPPPHPPPNGYLCMKPLQIANRGPEGCKRRSVKICDMFHDWFLSQIKFFWSKSTFRKCVFWVFWEVVCVIIGIYPLLQSARAIICHYYLFMPPTQCSNVS